MDKKMVADIRRNFSDKKSDELIQIWKENDRERWSDSAIEAAGQILIERGIKLPPQVPLKESKPQSTPKKSRQRTLARIFILIVIVWWSIAIFGLIYVGLIYKPVESSSLLIGAMIAFLSSCFFFMELGRREIRKPLPLSFGLLCAVLMSFLIFSFTSSLFNYRDFVSSIGTIVPILVFGYLAYRLSFAK